MEITGIVIGGIGLAALFDSCMNSFQYLDSGKHYGEEWQRSALKIAALELRLARWGQAVQFSEDTTDATEQQSKLVRDILGQVEADLRAAEDTSKRHQSSRAQIEGGSLVIENLTERFHRLACCRQKKASLGIKTRWALVDKRRMDGLIENIKKGVDDLVDIFPATASESQQQRRAAVEDAEELVRPAEVMEPEEAAESIASTLQKITAGVDPVLSEAISIAAQSMSNSDSYQDIKINKNARAAFDDFIASGYQGPAPTKRTTNRKFEGVEIGDQARVTFGRTYGGKGVFDD